MQCVEDNFRGGMLLLFGKALLNTVAGRPDAFFDLLEDRIFTCIESKVLSQKSKRVVKLKSYSARPAKGHGAGRPPKKPVTNSAE
jgi:hypothetical protein